VRISGLSIDGFGLFHDVEVRDLHPGLSLFVGDNEAGKSTTLAFVHTVLFGYPDGRTKENDYPPLQGGQPGGRLLVDSEADGALTLERRAGKKGGPMTVTFSDGRSEGDAALSRLLGGVTRSLYRKLYAFSLYELEQLESLSDEAVRDVIYGASLGTTSLSLPEVRSRLEARKGVLFKPGGSKPHINAVLKNLEEVRDRLQDAGRRTGDYRELSTELENLKARIQVTQGQLHHAREEHVRLKAHIQLWDDWTDLQDAEARLASLPVVVKAFPEEGLSRLDDLTGKIERETDSLRAVEEELREKDGRLQRLTFDSRLLELESEIRSLVRGLGTYEQAITDLPRVQEALKGQRRQAEEVLAEFGAGRTESWVLAMDRSSVARGQVESHQAALADADRRVEKAAEAENKVQEEREHLCEEAKAAAARIEVLELKLGDVMPPEVLTALRERRTQFQDVLHDLPGVKHQRAEAVDALTGALRDISSEWTVETLDAFDISLTARQKVVDSDARLSEASNVVREADNEAARTEANLAEEEATLLLKTEAVKTAEGNEVPLATLHQQKAWIRSLREAIYRHENITNEIERSRQMAEAAATGSSDGRSVSLGRRLRGLGAVISAVALVSTLVFWLYARPLVGLTGGAFLLLLAVALYLTGRAVAASGESESSFGEGASASQERMDLDAAAEVIDSLKGKLDLTGNATIPRVNDLEDENTTRTQQAEDLARLRQELKDIETTRDRRAESRDAAAAEAETAKLRCQKEERAWEIHVRSLQLPAGTSPRTAGEVFSKAETARGLVRQIADFDRRLKAMQRAHEEYLGLMQEASSFTGTATDDDGEKLLVRLAEFLVEADRQENQRRLLIEEQNATDKIGQELSAAERRLKQASDDRGKAMESEEEHRSAWSEWLLERGVAETWSPETCLRLQERAARLVELAVARDESTDKANRLEMDQESYEERVTVLSEQLNRPAPPQDKLVAEVHTLDAELDLHLKQRTLHEALADEIPELESRITSRKDHIVELDNRVLELVNKGQATDQEEFRTRGHLYEQRSELIGAIAEHEERVRKLAGVTKLEALRPELEDVTLQNLTVAEQEAREQVTELESQLVELQSEKARLDERRRQLLGEDDIARLRAEEESLLERFRGLSEDWACHAAALHLLSEAKDRFEKSHQPEVIHRAGEYFRGITNGRYKQVFAPHGEQTVEVIDDRDRRVSVENLSRGTSEQLYLAIRFGYIASQDANREQLPLLMDDVMVNFDPTRALQAAAGILQMAETHQVLYFTCHPEMVEVFLGHKGDTPVYEVGGGKIIGAA
jgi:uncharacterized protein YhaN